MTDARGRFPGAVILQDLKGGTRRPTASFRTRRETGVELRTSGSTGIRKRVFKPLTVLEAELSVLESTFGNELHGAGIVATVSPHHIYGLLFRILWPLCAGRPFLGETPLLWDDVLEAKSVFEKWLLVSSPAHLARVESLSSDAASGCRAVFSSGGALTPLEARQATKRLGTSVTEVFGSTETGGIGWRRQPGRKDSTHWTPLEGVQVNETPAGLLQVSSPWSGGVCLTGDRGTVGSDGRFLHQGRADQIVKIAEKRVSLTEVEKRLMEHPWIDRAVALCAKPGATPRALNAGVSLSPSGRNALAREGRSRFSSTLRSALRRRLDDAAVPKYFRFLDRLPMDAQGKVSKEAVERLFLVAYNPACTGPLKLKTSTVGSRREVNCRVPKELGYFEGHFPRFPVVPGVVELQWVMDEASRWKGKLPPLKAVEGLKFKQFLEPGQTFRITLDWKETAGGPVLSFSLAEGNVLFAEGRCRFS
ncbi:MAG: acyl-CoA synthetase [Elusimicrobia bacterium]|nr:acyl-CoA synthetase [Elusimicrobiota bacterium]